MGSKEVLNHSLLHRAPAWVLRATGILPAVDLDFQNGRYWQDHVFGRTAPDLVTTSRASSGTNLLPTSASGFAFATFGSNVARITPGSGLLVEEARTNQLLNSTAPATQTTASLATGAYTLWVNGSGTATPSAGTATITGITAAIQGSPGGFTVTGAGTVTVTKTGSLNAFQLEAGTFGTSLIVTAGSTATRAADVVTLTKVPVFGSAYTLFGKGTPMAPAGTFRGVIAIGDGTNNNRAVIGISAAGNANFVTALSNVVGLNASGGTVAQSVSAKFALAISVGDQAGVLNAGVPVTGSSANVPTGTTITTVLLGIGANSLLPLNGTIERITLWPATRLPNASLQQVTSP